MKVSTLENPITSRWLEINDLRLDGSPYLTGAIEARAILDKLPAGCLKPLQSVTKNGMAGIYHAGREGRQYVDSSEHGVRFMGSTDILAADLTNLPYLSKVQVQRNPLFTVHEQWTLITRSGTVGRMAFCRPDMDGLACSEHVLRVIADADKILPGYLYAFLSSQYGVPLVTAGTYGAIIQHIEPHHIANLNVPIPPRDLEEKVHALIVESAERRATSARNYARATKMIFDEIGVEDPPRHKWLADKRAVSFHIMSNGTASLRALNFDPRAEELRDNLKQGDYSSLGSLCDSDRFASGIIFRRIDADEEYGVRLVGQRGAFQVRPEGRWLSRSSIEGLGLLVPSGSTLIAAHGTLGETELYCRSIYVTNKTKEYAFSGDFVRCIPQADKVLPGYLFAFMRSESAFRLLRSISIGSKQQAHHSALLWNLPVPRVTADLETTIHNLVEEGAQAFDRGLEAEDEAWSLVETWIKGEAQSGSSCSVG